MTLEIDLLWALRAAIPQGKLEWGEREREREKERERDIYNIYIFVYIFVCSFVNIINIIL